eukprot:5887044-Amphidinium_carterae.1
MIVNTRPSIYEQVKTPETKSSAGKSFWPTFDGPAGQELDKAQRQLSQLSGAGAKGRCNCKQTVTLKVTAL